jgi:hypothetical protein
MKIIYTLFVVLIIALAFLWWRSAFALPIFCTTRGCVTNQEWNKEKEHQSAFADAANSSLPSDAPILTTLVRKHLILTTQNDTDMSQEAAKYRTEVLHFTEEEQLKQLGYRSFEEYDGAVTIPFLLQQAYMTEHSLKTPEEVYVNLSKNFRVVSLLFHYTWDRSKGEVVAR